MIEVLAKSGPVGGREKENGVKVEGNGVKDEMGKGDGMEG